LQRLLAAKSRQLELMDAGSRDLEILFSDDRPPEQYDTEAEQPQAS
jgi:hypothetical protein